MPIFRFRPPWWMREWIKDKMKIDGDQAARRKLYLSFAYAACAFVTFNLVVLGTGSPGIRSLEDEKNLSSADKTILAMRPTSGVRYVKYRIGEGVVESVNYSEQEIKDKYNDIVAHQANDDGQSSAQSSPKEEQLEK